MDYKIVIDAGHGGNDPGSSGNGIVEKDMNLAISNYMYNRFRELGVPVKIIRSTDETIEPTERVERIMDAFGNNRDVIVISNHINAGGGEGAEVIYALRNTNLLSDLVLDELSKEGQIIRKAYQRRLPTDTSKDYYFIQRDTGVTQPITIEYGFLDTATDATRLKNNFLDYAEATVRAVLEYINYGGEDTYTVVKGDSLWSIAKKFNTTVDKLKSSNNLSSNLLNVGQKLKIPKEEIPTQPGEYIVYTVVRGDTLYNIANRYGVTASELISYNNLPNSNLSIGQRLLIPTEITSNEQYSTYTVSKGDSLYNIANRYNTTVDNLMKINNLTNNLLSIGQKLLVPKTSQPSQGTQYVVKKNDNLYNIASRYNTTVDEIKRKNNLTSNLLSIGQVLIV